MEELDFTKIKNYMDEGEANDLASEMEELEMYQQELQDIRYITEIIKSSDIVVPLNLDLDNITPDDFFEAEQLDDDEAESIEIDFIRAIYQMTHVLYGVRYDYPLSISTAVTSIAALEEFSINEFKSWYKLIEDLSGLKILSGFEKIDNNRIKEFQDLETKKWEQDYIKSYVKHGLIDSITHSYGQHDNLSELISQMILLVERNIAEERFYSSTSVEVLGLFDASQLKSNIRRLNGGYLKDSDIDGILDHIAAYFEESEWEVIEYPIFLPPEKANYMWN